MGKYDIFLKYLGKENNFSPEEIKNQLNLDKRAEEIESTDVEANLSKVDELLEKLSSPSTSPPRATEEKEVEATEVDPELIKFLEKLDAPPPDISQLKEQLAITHYEGLTTEESPAVTEEGEEKIPTGFEEVVVQEEEIPETTPIAQPEEPSFAQAETPEISPSFQPEEQLGEIGELPQPAEELSELFAGISPVEEQPFEMPSPEEIKPEEAELSLEGFGLPEAETSFEAEIPQAEEEISIPSEGEEEVEISLPEEAMEEVRPVEEKKEISPEAAPAGGVEKIEIDPEKALKIRNRINQIKDSELRKKVRYALIESHLPKNLENELIKLLLLNESDSKLKDFIERNLPEVELRPPVEEYAGFEERPVKRQVIYSEAIYKQKEIEENLKKFTRYAAFGFVLLIILGFLMWRFIWIPGIVESVYKKGYAALSKNNTVEAENYFKRAKDMGGVSIKWYNLYAKKYVELTNYEAARRKYIEALDYAPLDKTTIYNFAEYYKTIYPPRYEDALVLYYRLYKKSPNNFEYLDKVARTYVEWGDRITEYDEKLKKYAEADRLYEGYLTKKPKYAGAYFRLLDIAIRLKRDDRIDILFDSLDKVNKRAVNEETFTSLARYYLDEKRYDRAKRVFEKLIPYLSPPSKTNTSMAMIQSESYYEYGRFLTINMDFLRAVKMLSNSINLNPKNSKSYNLLGEIYLLDERSVASKVTAKEMFEKAISYDPVFYKPYANLGHLYFYNSFNFTDPEKAYSQAFYYYKIASSLIGSENRDFLLSYNLGWLYYKYGDYENSLNEYSKIYVDESYNPVISYNLGNIFFKINKYELAKTQYEKAINYLEKIANKISYLNPELTRHKELYTQLARNYNNMGVVYLYLRNYFPRQKNQLEQEALLNFYKAKDSALRVNSLYSHAEYNIKTLLNKGIKNRTPAFDDEILQKTTLKKFIDEFKDSLIKNL
ncbi:MAG: hypothetical protein ACP5QT_06130 [Brevinematia bacterium]